MQRQRIEDISPLPMGDYLALERTKLSNERTFLAYVRTAIALTVAGYGALEFTQDGFIHYAGNALLAAALISLLVGLVRFLKTVHKLKRLVTAAMGKEKK